MIKVTAGEFRQHLQHLCSAAGIHYPGDAIPIADIVEKLLVPRVRDAVTIANSVARLTSGVRAETVERLIGLHERVDPEVDL